MSLYIRLLLSLIDRLSHLGRIAFSAAVEAPGQASRFALAQASLDFFRYDIHRLHWMVRNVFRCHVVTRDFVKNMRAKLISRATGQAPRQPHARPERPRRVLADPSYFPRHGFTRLLGEFHAIGINQKVETIAAGSSSHGSESRVCSHKHCGGFLAGRMPIASCRTFGEICRFRGRKGKLTRQPPVCSRPRTVCFSPPTRGFSNVQPRQEWHGIRLRSDELSALNRSLPTTNLEDNEYDC